MSLVCYGQDLKDFPDIKDMIMDDGELYSLGGYVHFCPGKEYITLDGQFTILELQQMAAYMQKHTEKHNVLEGKLHEPSR